jgi:hypothetical protein
MTTHSPSPLPTHHRDFDKVTLCPALPLYMSTIDLENGLRPIAWIPARLGKVLLQADELGLKHDHDESGPILEYHGQDTSEMVKLTNPDLRRGYWTMPVIRRNQCVNCVTEHMRRFARLCEEVFGLEKLTDSKRFRICLTIVVY